MHDFFKPWRRKLGVVTLVMACVLMGMWVRSQAKEDSIDIVVFHRLISFSSESGEIGISEFDDGSEYRLALPKWWSTSADEHRVGILPPIFFRYVRDEGIYSPPFSGLRVSYRSIVVPLTLLSAWLLLSNPRQTAPKQPNPRQPPEPDVRDFFKGWRRKVGCVTLVLACVLMAGWVRSTSVRDWVNLRRDIQTMNHIGSNLGRLTWIGYRENRSMETTGYQWHLTLNVSEADFFDGAEKKVHWHWKSCGFEFGKVTNGVQHTMMIWVIPYWSLVIPLTMLSARLLLSKPRSTAPRQTTEPVPTSGA